jgi:transcriptional regulator with XRE-family HTH domain
MSDVATYLEPADTMEAFLDAVKAKMKREGITKVELAKRLGIHETAIGKRLNGKAGNCTFQTADEIATALGTTTIELLTSVVRS